MTNVVEERAPYVDPEPGSRAADQWFSPVIHPRLGNSVLPERQGDFFSLNVPAWGDGGRGHTGYDFGDLQDGPGPAAPDGDALPGRHAGRSPPITSSWTSSSRSARTRCRTDWSPRRARAAVFPTSSTTSTEWGFTSGYGYADLPLIQLDYGRGDRPGGRGGPRHNTLTLAASHMPSVTGAGKVDGATLEVSYDDGANWTPAICTVRLTASGPRTSRRRAMPGTRRCAPPRRTMRATRSPDRAARLPRPVKRLRTVCRTAHGPQNEGNPSRRTAGVPQGGEYRSAGGAARVVKLLVYAPAGRSGWRSVWFRQVTTAG